MRVLCVADIHLRGGMDTDEAQALMQVAQIARDRSVDLVLVNGDVYEARSTPVQRLVFKHFLLECNDGGASVIVLRGNHDESEDLTVFGHYISGYRNEDIQVSEQPDRLEIWGKNEGAKLQVLTIPHFNAAAVALGATSQAALAETGTNLFDDILDGYFNMVQLYDGPSIVAYHGTVAGASLDNGMIPRQNGIQLNLERLMALGCPVVGGHYHQAQNVAEKDGGCVWYSGSITRQTFGEAEGDKGVLLFVYNPELPEGLNQLNQWDVEFISLTPTPMTLIEAEWYPDDALGTWDGWIILKNRILDPAAFAGHRVRFRYRVAQADLATVNLDRIHSVFAQAKELKIEQIVDISTAVRSEAMQDAESVADCVKVWLDSKQQSDKVQPVLDLLKVLENQAEAPVTAPYAAGQPSLFDQEELTHAF